MANLKALAYTFLGAPPDKTAHGARTRSISILIQREGSDAHEWGFATPQSLTAPDYTGWLGDTAYYVWFERRLSDSQRADALAHLKIWYPEATDQEDSQP